MGRAPRVVLTGARGTLDGLAPLLHRAGCEVREHPLLTFGPPASWDALDLALGQRERLAAIAITSPRAADALLTRLGELGIDPASLPPVWTGLASAARLGAVLPDLRTAPSSAVPGSLAVQLAEAMLAARVGSPILFPCGENHREELVVRLRAAGRRVDPVVVYRAVLVDDAAAAQALTDGDVVVVTSPRVVELLARVAPTALRPALITIGATTADAAERAGWPPARIAADPSVGAVFSAIHSLQPSLT